MTYVMATGGSGGHIVPAVLVARELIGAGHDVVFIGSFPDGNVALPQSEFRYIHLGARGIAHKPFTKTVTAALAMVGATFKAIRLIGAIKPDAVAGFGGYGSFPAVCAAVLLRRPTLIHEQNVVPGRANKLLARFVDKIMISFEESGAYFKPGKTVLTGCPCHIPSKNVNRERLLQEFRLHADKTTILVSGGSQGSSRINDMFIQTASRLRGQLDFQVIHISGKGDFQNLEAKYKEIGIPFALYDFFDKMEEAYGAADLVVSRSGAVTVSEIAGFGLPSIMVPYPHAQGHQMENAKVLTKTRLSRIIEDRDLSAESLSQHILEIVRNPVKSDRGAQTSEGICHFDAAQHISREIVSLKR